MVEYAFYSILITIFLVFLFYFFFYNKVTLVPSSTWFIKSVGWPTNQLLLLSPNRQKSKNTLIWLHDYQKSPEIAMSSWDTPKDRSMPKFMKIIIPRAPEIEISFLKNSKETEYQRFSWYNFKNQVKNILLESSGSQSTADNQFKPNEKQFDQEQILTQVNRILQIIDEEKKDRDPSSIFIGGLSQGANLALATFLKYEGEKPLGGLINYFGSIPLSPSNIDLSQKNKSVLSQTPIFWLSGPNTLIKNSNDIDISLQYLKSQIYPENENEKIKRLELKQIGTITSNSAAGKYDQAIQSYGKEFGDAYVGPLGKDQTLDWLEKYFKN